MAFSPSCRCQESCRRQLTAAAAFRTLLITMVDEIAALARWTRMPLKVILVMMLLVLAPVLRAVGVDGAERGETTAARAKG